MTSAVEGARRSLGEVGGMSMFGDFTCIGGYMSQLNAQLKALLTRTGLRMPLSPSVSTPRSKHATPPSSPAGAIAREADDGNLTPTRFRIRAQLVSVLEIFFDIFFVTRGVTANERGDERVSGR